VTPAPRRLPEPGVGIERLFVSVGTDFHRFDRLMRWLDEWMAADADVHHVVVQRGTSVEPTTVTSVDYLQRGRLISEFQDATVVVCHGGPATILECRANGLVPIVVPREQRFSEHVNDHQVDFCERLAAHDEIQLARTKSEFFRLLDLAVERGAPEVAVDDGHAAIALGNFEDAMIDLLGTRAASTPAALAEVVELNADDEKIPVLFIGSVPRSGSSIISELLDEHPHMVNIGEMVHMWQRGVIDNDRCGCGEPFSDCDFWTKVGEVAFGGWKNISGERMRTLQQRADRTRFIPALLTPRISRQMLTSVHQYGAVVARVLAAVREVSGAPIIIDTSKHVSTALLLRQIPQIDLRVVHLIRDPRGVAHSWSKQVKRPEVTGASVEMDRLHPGRIGLRWLWFNWAFSNMDRLDVPSLTIRYEDFVADPQESLNQMFDFGGVDPIAESLMENAEPRVLDGGHSVSGNPGRLNREPVEIRADEGWKTGLDPRMRGVVTLITKPMRRRYHYPEGG